MARKKAAPGVLWVAEVIASFSSPDWTAVTTSVGLTPVVASQPRLWAVPGSTAKTTKVFITDSGSTVYEPDSQMELPGQ